MSVLKFKSDDALPDVNHKWFDVNFFLYLYIQILFLIILVTKKHIGVRPILIFPQCLRVCHNQLGLRLTHKVSKIPKPA